MSNNMISEKGIGKYMGTILKDFSIPPINEILINGVKDGKIIPNITKQYAQAYINFVEVIDAYMIRTKESDIKWKEKCDRVENFLRKSTHSDIGHPYEYGDIAILAKSEKSYWFFYDAVMLDETCTIGRFLQTEVPESLLGEQFLEFLQSVESTPLPEGSYLRIPASYFTGWITL